MERAITHKGWTLVQVGQYYYSACKGNRRVGVGSVRHGDWADLVLRFRKKVDELETE